MSYSTPVLSGSIPNPATQPLTGVLTWTESDSPNNVPAPSLLVHADTALVDDSIYANTLVATEFLTEGLPRVDTGLFMFGTGSISNGGNVVTDALYATVTPAGVLDFSSGDFTMECWVYIRTATSAAAPFFHVYDSGGGNVVAPVLAPNSVTITLTTGSVVLTNTTSLAEGAWHHVAVVRQGNNFDFFIDGTTATGGVQSSTHNLAAMTYINVFGAQQPPNVQGSNNCAYANVDEYRLLQGYAAYTPGLSFTPPIAAFSSGPSGGGTPATGYDIYRDGVSITTVGQVLTYTDTVPADGVYTYNVAAWSGSVDESALSNTVTLDYQPAVLGFPNCIFDEVIYGGYFGGQLNLVEFTYMPGRTPFVEGATNLIINRYKQEPTDSRQRGVDFTQFVVPGELLQTVVVSGINAQGVAQASTNPLVTPLVVSDLVIDPVTQLKFAYTVSGGQNGIEYTVQFTTTTNIQTETLEEIFSINIMIEDMFP